jgi:hypothetical protein
MVYKMKLNLLNFDKRHRIFFLCLTCAIILYSCSNINAQNRSKYIPCDDEYYIYDLCDELNYGSNRLPIKIIEAIGKCKEKAHLAIPTLKKYFEKHKSDCDVTSAIIKTYGEIGYKTVDELIKILQDILICSRHLIPEQLGKIKRKYTKSTIPILANHLFDKDDEIREASYQALQSMGVNPEKEKEKIVLQAEKADRKNPKADKVGRQAKYEIKELENGDMELVAFAKYYIGLKEDAPSETFYKDDMLASAWSSDGHSQQILVYFDLEEAGINGEIHSAIYRMGHSGGGGSIDGNNGISFAASDWEPHLVNWNNPPVTNSSPYVAQWKGRVSIKKAVSEWCQDASTNHGILMHGTVGPSGHSGSIFYKYSDITLTIKYTPDSTVTPISSSDR